MAPSRYKALYGGRGSAKSHFFAEALVANAAENEGFRALCVREVQKSLKESSKRLIEDKIQKMGSMPMSFSSSRFPSMEEPGPLIPVTPARTQRKK